MAVYILSDLHFRDKGILRFRSDFSSVEEHDQYIIDNIFRTCGRRDTLYLLGDVCVGRDSLPLLKRIFDQVEYLHLVLGNHDAEKKGAPKVRDLLSACSNVYGMKRYKQSWLTHSPMHPQELYGKINIHGHTHKKVIDDPRYVNVCCEQLNYTPVNVETIFQKA